VLCQLLVMYILGVGRIKFISLDEVSAKHVEGRVKVFGGAVLPYSGHGHHVRQ
jgi:hypothetical protein